MSELSLPQHSFYSDVSRDPCLKRVKGAIMARVVTKNFHDTPISGVTSLSFPRGLVNFKADFSEKSRSATEYVATNLRSPLDAPEIIRWGNSRIADVYRNSGVSKQNQPAAVQGFSLLAQETFIATVTDTVDTTYKVDLPISAHLVFKAPTHENVTADLLLTALGRLVSSLYSTGSVAPDRLEGLIRGALAPTEI